MKFVNQSYTIESPIDAQAIYSAIERAGRTCYKSESKIAEGTAERFVRMILGRHHESVIEHEKLTVRFATNRGVSHELVRHRIASFSQESTRYVNYGGRPMEFITPSWLPELAGKEFTIGEASGQVYREDVVLFVELCTMAEDLYNQLLAVNWTPQQAREVLPNALKTEIVVTANLREWRHILRERTSPAAHPQMRALMRPLLLELRAALPAIFEDLPTHEQIDLSFAPRTEKPVPEPQMSKKSVYLVTVPAREVSGEQVFEVSADSPEEAIKLVEAGEGEVVEENLEVQSLAMSEAVATLKL